MSQEAISKSRREVKVLVDGGSQQRGKIGMKNVGGKRNAVHITDDPLVVTGFNLVVIYGDPSLHRWEATYEACNEAVAHMARGR